MKQTFVFGIWNYHYTHSSQPNIYVKQIHNILTVTPYYRLILAVMTKDSQKQKEKRVVKDRDLISWLKFILYYIQLYKMLKRHPQHSIVHSIINVCISIPYNQYSIKVHVQGRGEKKTEKIEQVYHFKCVIKIL